MIQLKTTKKMTRYPQKNAESDRSMVEILGVMVLIGILTIGAYMGISLAFDKHHANQIIHDSKIAFTEAYATLPTSAKEWQSIPFQQQSKETLLVRFDLKDRLYVKAMEVEKDVCIQMLTLRAENRLEFYQTDGQLLTTCQNTQDIIIDWAGNGAPNVCATTSDCDTEMGGESGFDGICTGDGQCRTCPENQTPNTDRTKCICNPDQAITCTINDKSWCCGENLICGAFVGECLETDGTCAYDFYPDGEAPGTIYYTDCSYLVSGDDQVEQYKADCSYSISDESGVEQYRSDCNYTVQQTASTSTNWVDGSGQSLTLYPSQSGGTFVTLGTGCPQNQYCGLRWQDSNNDGTWGAGETQTAPDNATGILWGKCQVLNTFESEPITDYQAGQGKVVQMIGCPENQYCGLRWLDDDNDGVWGAGETQTAPSNASGILWGKCQVLNTFESEPITTYTPGYGRVTVVEGCPPDMYCGLRWTQEEWSAGTSTPTASASATRMLYGRCQNLQTFISEPLSRNDSGNTRYGIQKGCPLKTYCYLNWISDTSCETASESATGTIFGVCSPMTERGNCPYENESQ